MRYRVIHRTTYRYASTVSVGSHIACLIPRSLALQDCKRNLLRIIPAPATQSERVDFFGNRLTLFTIEEPHRKLIVESRSRVDVLRIDRAGAPGFRAPWERATKLTGNLEPETLDATQFRFESPRISPKSEYAEYAAQSFSPGRAFGEALLDFTARIYRDFKFDSKATNVRTPTEEVFLNRRGVCQDFAHLQIACLRSLGLAARYVSGYLRTYPPPGRERLVGADASHAWVSAYCPGAGWLDVDPTNNLVPSDGHVTLAWGRDYGDVSPLRGLVLGGRQHKLRVAVDMKPLDD